MLGLINDVLRLEGKERTEVTFLGQQNVSCVTEASNRKIPLMREKKLFISKDKFSSE